MQKKEKKHNQCYYQKSPQYPRLFFHKYIFLISIPKTKQLKFQNVFRTPDKLQDQVKKNLQTRPVRSQSQKRVTKLEEIQNYKKQP